MQESKERFGEQNSISGADLGTIGEVTVGLVKGIHMKLFGKVLFFLEIIRYVCRSGQ